MGGKMIKWGGFKKNRLYELRTRKGLTLTQLSIVSRVSIGALHNYEKGKVKPISRNIKRLSDALGVAIEYFFV